MEFSRQLQSSANIFWEKEKTHDFILGIGSGDLETRKFTYYLKQDYVFLIGFCKVISIAISKSPDLSYMLFLSTLLKETLSTEMNLHVEYCEEFNIQHEDLKKTDPSPTTLGYINHMIESAQIKGFLHALVAILPCAWSYGEIATNLKNNDSYSSDNKYNKWITMYASDQFKSLALSLINILNKESKELSEKEKIQLQKTFVKSSEYEYLFWEASWNMEIW